MKNKLLLKLMCISAGTCSIILAGCGDKKVDTTDYSKVTNWFKCDYTGTKEVDTFFIYPTVVMNNDGDTTIDQNRKDLATSGVYETQTSVFANSTNIYMPLYRQISLNNAAGSTNRTFVSNIMKNVGYKDIVGSLDYYFANFNNNKPFILAGHSQGSATLNAVLIDYMQAHPEYLSRMVACYAIGFGFSKSEIAKYQNLKFAEGEKDTGCIISYNTYGPDHTGDSVLLNDDCWCINPINWKTDDTYAPAEENKGSFIKGQFMDKVADAKVNVDKGYIVTNADEKYETKGAANLFGTHTFHEYDYGFYHKNLEDNVEKRISSYLKK